MTIVVMPFYEDESSKKPFEERLYFYLKSDPKAHLKDDNVVPFVTRLWLEQESMRSIHVTTLRSHPRFIIAAAQVDNFCGDLGCWHAYAKLPKDINEECSLAVEHIFNFFD